MKENVVLDKSYLFALRIVRLYKHLEDKREYVMSKQLLAAGTNVGAFVKAAQEAEPGAGFYREMNFALQKASLTEYWLQLLHESEFLDDEQFTSIHNDCVELIKLLKAITRPTRRN